MDNSASDATQPNEATDQEPLNDLGTMARSLGLKPVRAWIPDATLKNAKSGAARTQWSRAKAESLGLKQISVTLPAELHPLLKDFATRTKMGEPALLVLSELVTRMQPSVKPAVLPTSLKETPTQKHVVLVAVLPWWRRWLLRWLLPACTFDARGRARS